MLVRLRQGKHGDSTLRKQGELSVHFLWASGQDFLSVAQSEKGVYVFYFIEEERCSLLLQVLATTWWYKKNKSHVSVWDFF